MANLTNDGNQTTFQEFYYCYGVVDGKYQQVFLLTLNILISVAAFLGNALIIVALPKVSSLHPSSKLLLSCLVWSDLSVGLISEPSYITFLLSPGRTSLCYYSDTIYAITAVFFCGVSIQTITAISMDRLLALSLGLRYRQIVTIKRVRVFILICCLLSSAASLLYLFDDLYLIHTSITCIGLFVFVTVSTLCYTKIYRTLRYNHSQVHDNINQEPPSEGRTPLNIARYRKTVSSVLWVQVSLIACYLPYGLVTILSYVLKTYPPSFYFVTELTFALLMFNSCINPILYCWKITGVRQAVIEIIRKCFHLSA